MNSIDAVARSGLQLASTQLEVSAHNVANALTPGYQPGRVVAAEAAGGGVVASVVRGADPAGEARAERALLAPSRTDLVAEVVAQSRAARVYQANLATLRTADELLAETLHLKP